MVLGKGRGIEISTAPLPKVGWAPSCEKSQNCRGGYNNTSEDEETRILNGLRSVTP
ncbi:hypothetical protein [Clostridium butyricum]|uniref:hypothetical protein n=1 Tax=Clostridium butyricum TaxID=1492 RepID=UPI00164A8A28|nr:hypothetical protein [Clostridium butyricum]